jgi:hypothetical protein
MDDSSLKRPGQRQDPAEEVLAAIELATAFLPTVAPDPSEYQLVAAARLLGESGPGRGGAWRLTFKRRQLIPSEAETEIGAGGEVFVEVDLASQAALLIGYGE